MEKMTKIFLYFIFFCFNSDNCIFFASSTLTTTDSPTTENSIKCTENEIEVAIEVNSMQIVSPYSYFDDHSCTGSFNGTHIILKTGLNQCGTQIKFTSSTEITYYNSVWYMDAESDGSVISRSGQVKLLVECSYSRDKALSSGSFTPNFDLFETFVQGFGDISFSMNMYKSSNFSEPYSADDYPVKVEVGQTLYVGVSAHSSTPGLELLIDSCKASASDNPLNESVFTYQLIDEGCPEDITVEYISSNSSFSKWFSFEAFVFVDRSSKVFLHCEAILCSRDDGNSCDLVCMDQPLKRRSVSPLANAQRNIITIGPLSLG